MRVILKKEVYNLGEAGEIVKVAPGYGRNHLIPNGLAVPASEGSVREVEHQNRIADAIRRRDLSDAKATAEKLAKTSITIRREAGSDEKLFGSVSNRDIAEALATESIVIDRKRIDLEDPIRKIGMFDVKVRLHREVEASVRVFVIRA